MAEELWFHLHKDQIRKILELADAAQPSDHPDLGGIIASLENQLVEYEADDIFKHGVLD